MATINGKSNFVEQGTWRSVWPALGNADSGTPDEVSRFSQHSVQFGAVDPTVFPAPAAGVGTTFGGATAVMEGSDDGVTYFTLKDVYGSAVSTAVAARFDLNDVPRYMRPRTSGGTGTSVTVVMHSHPVNG